jgi:TonB family protein
VEALENGVQGRVIVQATVDASGQLSDQTIVSCRRELCQAAVDSLPTWQFDSHQANTTRAINIDFVNPLYAQAVMPPAPGIDPSPVARGVPTFVARTAWLNGAYVDVLPATLPSALGHTLSEIRIAGLSDSASNQLQSRLPVRSGDPWSAAAAALVKQIVTDFDSHLEADLIHDFGSQQWSLWIGPADDLFGQPVIALPPLPPGVYQAGGNVKPPTVIRKFDPAYTDGARAAKISGTVTLSVVVAADGTPQNIQVIGPLDPGLDQSATDAVSKWRFRPGTKDGGPVSIQTQVSVSFRLL